jgi:hypothetical protein
MDSSNIEKFAFLALGTFFTGGGPAPKKTTSSVEKIVTMMQDTASFAGIEGGLQRYVNNASHIIIEMSIYSKKSFNSSI